MSLGFPSRSSLSQPLLAVGLGFPSSIQASTRDLSNTHSVQGTALRTGVKVEPGTASRELSCYGGDGQQTRMRNRVRSGKELWGKHRHESVGDGGGRVCRQGGVEAVFWEVQTPMREEMWTVEWFGRRTVAGAQSQGEKGAVACEEQQAGRGPNSPRGLQRTQHLRLCRGCRSLCMCLGPQQPKACEMYFRPSYVFSAPALLHCLWRLSPPFRIWASPWEDGLWNWSFFSPLLSEEKRPDERVHAKVLSRYLSWGVWKH